MEGISEDDPYAAQHRLLIQKRDSRVSLTTDEWAIWNATKQEYYDREQEIASGVRPQQ